MTQTAPPMVSKLCAEALVPFLANTGRARPVRSPLGLATVPADSTDQSAAMG